VTRPARVSGTRLAHLDRLKTVLVAVIIVAHGLLGYCAIDDVWPYQPVREVGLSPITEAAVELAVLPGVLFTMGLFFSSWCRGCSRRARSSARAPPGSSASGCCGSVCRSRYGYWCCGRR
jgi:hypothetical protein